MKLGYSFWGFLGQGITDTPDGGRSHRRTLVDGIGALGVEIVFLQPNRDLLDAGSDLRDNYRWDRGFPNLDRLFLEWRWPIPMRNTTPCGSPGHTCDLHRQDALVEHYTRRRQTPTIVWDKDRQLPAGHPLRAMPHVTVCEPALHPSPGARSLLFPVPDAAIAEIDPLRLVSSRRDIPLVYVGNQYDRDDAFDEYFVPAARTVRHVVAGKWSSIDAWDHVTFLGRVPFADVDRLYRRSIATILLLPQRYAAVGHMTQRIFEAVLAGCIPLVPTAIHCAGRFAPPELQVETAHDVIERLADLQAIAGSTQHARLLEGCARSLDLFRLSNQLPLLDELLLGDKESASE